MKRNNQKQSSNLLNWIPHQFVSFFISYKYLCVIRGYFYVGPSAACHHESLTKHQAEGRFSALTELAAEPTCTNSGPCWLLSDMVPSVSVTSATSLTFLWNYTPIPIFASSITHTEEAAGWWDVFRNKATLRQHLVHLTVCAFLFQSSCLVTRDIISGYRPEKPKSWEGIEYIMKTQHIG